MKRVTVVLICLAAGVWSLPPGSSVSSFSFLGGLLTQHASAHERYVSFHVACCMNVCILLKKT